MEARPRMRMKQNVGDGVLETYPARALQCDAPQPRARRTRPRSVAAASSCPGHRALSPLLQAVGGGGRAGHLRRGADATRPSEPGRDHETTAWGLPLKGGVPWLDPPLGVAVCGNRKGAWAPRPYHALMSHSPNCFCGQLRYYLGGRQGFSLLLVQVIPPLPWPTPATSFCFFVRKKQHVNHPPQFFHVASGSNIAG